MDLPATGPALTEHLHPPLAGDPITSLNQPQDDPYTPGAGGRA
ncbi:MULTISPECIES: hypothetical protein [unclassified Streptomyces]